MELSELNQKSEEWLKKEIKKGGRFVTYSYSISIVAASFQRYSKIYFLRHYEAAINHGYPYLLISFFLGWWGIPFGPIFTIASIIRAFKGRDVTNEVLTMIRWSDDGPQIPTTLKELDSKGIPQKPSGLKIKQTAVTPKKSARFHKKATPQN